jgi:1,4-alpha-glucan branching enzyme
LIIDDLSNRILKQIVKELLLIQASDWQFIIHNQAARDYAEMRFTNHDSDFDKLCSLIEKHKNSNNTSQNNLTDEDLNYLSTVETRDFIFPELDVNWWNDRFNGI